MEPITINDFLRDLLYMVLTIILPFVVRHVTNYLSAKAEEKTSQIKNEKTRKYVNAASQAVLSAVLSTFQTYVDSLKKSGTFTEEAQKEAFNKAKAVAMKMITDDAREAIKDLYGDFDTWLDNLIEKFVKANKDGTVRDALMMAYM